MATTAQAQAFFEKYGSLFIRTTGNTPLLPSVKAAQAALESGYGTSQTMVNANAFFGIKATGKSPYWTGKVYNSKTKEVISGSTVTITSGFRAYDSLEQGSFDHTYLLSQSRYSRVMQATDYKSQCQAIQSSGYATDPNYASKLISIIEKYNLTKLDAKKKMNKIVITTGCSLCILFLAFIIYKQYA